MNVREIDAASNNGVDTIRDIRDDVAYSPTNGRYKVYIIDEVHMLSQGAFNALLKTLEEPPEYVIFIFATTEAHKIPVTILSRCQRYDFKRISVNTIVERLKELMAGEEIQAEDKALTYIARQSDGALRDAISLFDQCNAFYYKEVLTYEKALTVLGAVDTSVFSELVRDILSSDLKAALHLMDEVVLQGKELSQFIIDLTWYLRNLLLLNSSEHEGMEEVIDVSSENLERLQEEADLLSQETIMRYIRIFSELSGDLRYSSQKRVLIDIALIKLCRPRMESDYSSVTERVRVLEEEIDKLTAAFNEIRLDPGKAESLVLEPRKDTVSYQVEEVPLPETIEENILFASKKRTEIVSHLTNMMRHMLNGAVWSSDDGKQLLIVPKTEELAGYLNNEVYSTSLSAAIEQVVGAKVEFEIRSPFIEKDKKKNYEELSTISGIDMEIEEEE